MFITNIVNDIQKIQNEMARALSGQDLYYSEFPAVQVYSDKDHLMLRAEVPGLTRDSLDVSITEDVVMIKGEIPRTEVAEGVRVIRRERRTGKFEKTVELPLPVDADRSEAVLAGGVLTLTFPIREAVKPKQIQVKVN